MDKEYWMMTCSETWAEKLPDLAKDEVALAKEVQNTWNLAFSVYMAEDFVLKYTDPVLYANHCIKIWVEKQKQG